MDAILTLSLQLVYNGGCRSNMKCNAGLHIAGKRRWATDNVQCSSCCNTTNMGYGQCNTNLCGIKSSRGSNETNQCYYCGPWDDAKQSSVTDPRYCRNLKTCAENEVCRMSTRNTAGVNTFEFGCSQLLQCQVLTIASIESHGVNTGVDLSNLLLTGQIVGRKRQTSVCDICCGDGLCNNDQCESMRTRIIQFASQGKFNYTSLTLIK
ncbi:hypothetical protein ACJMK2_038695 [Sinanodonta woodiana]|uniref:Sodefrin-like factor n=1 Tax=Sinanodonta woodiana TaxID=1069815 RepID=A0ABD3WBP3_SINWO